MWLQNKYRLFVYSILTIGALCMVFPFVWMVLSAFKTERDVWTYPPRWIPSKWQFYNFVEVFRIIPLGRYFMNTLVVTTAITIGQTSFSILAAYALARFVFPLKSVIEIIVMGTLIMPFVVLMIPTFIIVYKLGWVDSYQGLIFPFLFNGFSIFFLRQFFLTIPKDLEDAAKIDGCGYLGILRHVIIPNARPAIATITLFTFLTEWRSYMWPLIVTNSAKMRTLPIGLKYFIGEAGGEYHLLMAASLLSTLPVLLIYIIAERQFVRSITFTGLKG